MCAARPSQITKPCTAPHIQIPEEIDQEFRNYEQSGISKKLGWQITLRTMTQSRLSEHRLKSDVRFGAISYQNAMHEKRPIFVQVIMKHFQHNEHFRNCKESGILKLYAYLNI